MDRELPGTVVRTRRLNLIPCSLDIGEVVLADRLRLARLLGVRVPTDWPARETLDFLPVHLQRLEADPGLLDWGIRLIVRARDHVIIGDVGFHGRPDHDGTVEIGFSVLPAFRNRGYAQEAAQGLIAWAFTRPGVTRIVATCHEDNAPSLRVLRKLGMKQTGTLDESLVRWELTRREHALRNPAPLKPGGPRR